MNIGLVSAVPAATQAWLTVEESFPISLMHARCLGRSMIRLFPVASDQAVALVEVSLSFKKWRRFIGLKGATAECLGLVLNFMASSEFIGNITKEKASQRQKCYADLKHGVSNLSYLVSCGMQSRAILFPLIFMIALSVRICLDYFTLGNSGQVCERDFIPEKRFFFTIIAYINDR